MGRVMQVEILRVSADRTAHEKSYSCCDVSHSVLLCQVRKVPNVSDLFGFPRSRHPFVSAALADRKKCVKSAVAALRQTKRRRGCATFSKFDLKLLRIPTFGPSEWSETANAPI
jgi:hypothetical protein